MSKALLLWQVGLIANVKLHFSMLTLLPKMDISEFPPPPETGHR